ncbi:MULTISPECIES: DUF732 domain-containing protein [unclassified Mycobacterium]|uniref:DUF732 domain-containing protein n=1 Tax=unclassified Mycobacterium TaxID=2642494 RepID=UPI0007401D63|nr:MULTISPECIES: DUF732 domain-containing protein [unclassified Mycobacterium]KUH81531.1 hypothetical protein AU185_16915 [Mycobacterium sp. GA-0227b]KUH83658.1 hypothetical protein AU186_16610 [Mycobacterium sp. GA-1999]
MTFRRGKLTVVTVAAALAVFGSAANANAQGDDKKFADEVAALEIPVGPEVDVPALGRNVCEALTQGLAGTVNPVPVVRGVVNSLANNGISRAQAAGLMRAAVVVYCPQHARFTGR